MFPDASTAARTAPSAAAPVRAFGPFELRSLQGRSHASMAWRVTDRRGIERLDGILMLPRVQPADAGALQRWLEAVRRAARLRHPHLAEAREIGVWEHWPYVFYAVGAVPTLADRLRGPALAVQEAAAVGAQLLRGLAFAHDGGVAHHDLQPYAVLVGDEGAKLLGLEVAGGAAEPQPGVHSAFDALQLTRQREAAQSDLQSVGLLLHWVLAGRPALDEADIAVCLSRMPPAGRELVRLPWNTPLPVPEALRAIANRATDRQPRQRYRSARGMQRALEGWLHSDGAAGTGPLALLLDRLHAAGALPSAPGGAAREARLAGMDRERTIELAGVVLEDLGLAFELLRSVNAAQLRATLPLGSGAVLTVRRAIAMLGLEGVRQAAAGLRPWPGPLSGAGAAALAEAIGAAQYAGRVARALRPPAYDAEAVQLVALLQNLGRLLVAYHFADEWQQILRLMQPVAPVASVREGAPEEPGMDEQAAAYAVLGADVESIGAAVARHWGLDEPVLHLIRRLPRATPPRSVDTDDDLLRALASCANEAVDAAALPADRAAPALRRVALRYARPLRLTLDDLKQALQVSRGKAAIEG